MINSVKRICTNLKIINDKVRKLLEKGIEQDRDPFRIIQDGPGGYQCTKSARKILKSKLKKRSKGITIVNILNFI